MFTQETIILEFAESSYLLGLIPLDIDADDRMDFLGAASNILDGGVVLFENISGGFSPKKNYFRRWFLRAAGFGTHRY